MSVHLRRAELVFGYAKAHGLRCHQNRRRYGFHRRYQFGDDLSFLPAIVPGSTEECETVTAPADLLDFGKATDERIRNPKGLGQILVAHGEKSPLTRGLNASASACARRANHRYSHVSPGGFSIVNRPSVRALLEQPAQITGKSSCSGTGQGSAQDNAALLTGVVGFLKINEANDAHQFVSHLDVAALAKSAGDHCGFGQRQHSDGFTHHANSIQEAA